MASIRLRPALVIAAALLATLGTVTAQGAVRGLKVVTSDAFIAGAGVQTRTSLACPRGHVPLGGGAFISGSNAIGLASSFPVNQLWIVDVSNPTAQASTFRIRLV